jgi:hypothetical protein
LAKSATDVAAALDTADRKVATTVQTLTDETNGKIATVNGALEDLEDDTDTKIQALKSEVTDIVQPAINKVTEAQKVSEAATDTRIKAITLALLGTSLQFPGDTCMAIKAAKPSATTGRYFIKSKVQSAPIEVWCGGSGFHSLGGDGTSKAAAVSTCDGFSKTDFEKTSSKFWVDPDANADDTNNAKLTQCENDLFMKLVTTDGNIMEWDNALWQNTAMKNEAQAADSKWKSFRSDIKAKG